VSYRQIGPVGLQWEPWRYVNATLLDVGRWLVKASLGWHAWSLGVVVKVAGDGWRGFAFAVGPLHVEVRRYTWKDEDYDDLEDDDT
jgi:hypothetical protein